VIRSFWPAASASMEGVCRLGELSVPVLDTPPSSGRPLQRNNTYLLQNCNKSEARVHGLGFQGQNREDALVDAGNAASNGIAVPASSGRSPSIAALNTVTNATDISEDAT
jgi:hypothetical protein